MTREQKREEDALSAAAEWSARLASDQASEQDFLDFEGWLATPGHREAYDRIEAGAAMVDRHAQELRLAIGDDPRKTARVIQHPRSSRIATRWVAWAGGLAAAAAAAVILVIPALSPGRSAPDDVMVYSAPVQAARTVVLADGSEVVLNRGATIRVQSSAAGRKVELAAGEAAFKVVHDASRPFSVSTGEEAIVDLGTEFNVLNAEQALVVTVLSGKVRVDLPAGQHVSLTGNQQLRFNRVARQAVIESVNSEDAVSWKAGRLVFHDAPLSAVVDQLNRYADTPIRLADNAISDLRFSGVLVVGPAASMVSQLKAFLPVRSDDAKEAISLRSE